MPRYHFDVINGHGLERDDVGADVATDAVPGHVARILTDIAREELPTTPSAVVRVTVRDENNRTVFQGELYLKAEWTK